MALRQFNETVNALRFGTLHDDLSKALHDLTAQCATTGRAGALTLTLQLKPGKGGQIEVFDDIKLKLPKEEKGSSIMFVTPENNLQREDPRQLQIEGLRSVDKDTGELRNVKAG